MTTRRGREREPSGPPTHPEDFARVASILAGDDGEWHTLLAAHAEDIVSTALRWCRPGCLHPCPFNGVPWSALYSHLVSRDQDCDEVSSAYEFIISKIRGKSLPSYQGRCSLRTYLYPLLRPTSESDENAPRNVYNYHKLFSDYLRATCGRVRAPKPVAALGEFETAVFVRVCYGKGDAEMTSRLALSPANAARLPAVRERIRRALLDAGWDHYWKALGHRVFRDEIAASQLSASTNGEEERDAIEDAGGSVDVELQARAAIGRTLLVEALFCLSPQERVALRLSCCDHRSVREVGVALGMQEKQARLELSGALRHLRSELRKSGAEPSDDDDDIRDALEVWWGEQEHDSGRAPSAPGSRSAGGDARDVDGGR